MIKFCSTCGSILAEDVCTNKRCTTNKNASPTKKRKTVKKSTTGEVVTPATRKVVSDYDKARKNSKVVTYSIQELEDKQNKE